MLAAATSNPSFDLITTELRRRRAVVRVHGSRSLYDRLVGVYAILETWGAAEDVCFAGLLHTAYANDEASLFRADERGAVRELIGDRAARILDVFSAIDRSGAFRSFPSVHRFVEAQTENREFPELADLTSGELRAAVAIHVARVAERSGTSHMKPEAWLASAAQLHASIGSDVPFLASLSGFDLASGEPEILSAYDAILEAPLCPKRRVRLLAASKAVPLVGEPMVLLALGSLALGDPQRAADEAKAGRSRIEEFGTAWDGRLPATNWLSIALFVEQAASAVDDAAEFFATVVHGALERNLEPESLFVRLSGLDVLPTPIDAQEEPDTGLDAAGDIFSDGDDRLIPDRFAEFLDGLLEDEPHRALAYYPGLREQPWWDAEQFPLVQALEASAADIAAEFASLDLRQFHRESERIHRGGAWDVFILYERGKKREERCAAVPITSSIIERHSVLRTQAGLVYFSRLAPGSVVAPHRGPTNMRLRCHLGIQIPSRCHITVDNDTRSWTEGKCIVFDDSYTHSVWNSSDHDRIVLIVDIWHPDLDSEEVALLSGLHRYGSLVGESLDKYWRKNDEAALVAAG